MKSLRTLFVLTLLLMGIQVAVAQDGTMQRIKFKKGATQTIVTGRLNGIRDMKCYVFSAKANQKARLEIKAKGATRGFLKMPSGQGDGAPGGLFYDDFLPETGDYQVCVTESLMGEAWKGSFSLYVTIK